MAARNQLRIVLYVQQSGEDERYLIGTVVPPTVNSLPIFRREEIHVVLDSLWSEWREADQTADSDSQFVQWLVAEKGWKEVESNEEHVFDS